MPIKIHRILKIKQKQTRKTQAKKTYRKKTQRHNVKKKASKHEYTIKIHRILQATNKKRDNQKHTAQNKTQSHK